MAVRRISLLALVARFRLALAQVNLLACARWTDLLVAARAALAGDAVVIPKCHGAASGFGVEDDMYFSSVDFVLEICSTLVARLKWEVFVRC